MWSCINTDSQSFLIVHRWSAKTSADTSQQHAINFSANLQLFVDSVLDGWAYQGEYLYGACEPLWCALTASSGSFPSDSSHMWQCVQHIVCLNDLQQPHSVYVPGSHSTACNSVLGVICFSINPKIGDRKQISVIAFLTGRVEAITVSLFHLSSSAK